MGADWRPRRARAPCLENKNSAPQARFRSQTPSKQAKVHAFWLPKQQCNQPQPPQPPHWSTRPTGPVDHPADPPTHRAPHPHPTLALGLRTLGAPGPPQGPLFSVFVLPCSLTASDTPGRPLNERSKTLGPTVATVARTSCGWTLAVLYARCCAEARACPQGAADPSPFTPTAPVIGACASLLDAHAQTKKG